MLTKRQQKSLCSLTSIVNSLPSNQLVKVTQAQFAAMQKAYSLVPGPVPPEIIELAKKLGL